MQYQLLVPSEKLRLYVSEFLILQDSCPTTKTNIFKVIADGTPGLVIQKVQNSFLMDGDKLPKVFLHGLTTFAKNKIITGGFENVIVLFRPYGIKSVFGIDSCELTNQYLDINDILKNTLSDQLLTAQNLNDKINVIEDFIWAQLNKNKQNSNCLCAYFVNNFFNENYPTLSEMQLSLNISERTLERLFKQFIGVSPKNFLRICRFQASIISLQSKNHTSLTKLAYENQYTDQSHFIRDFKEFSGVTPGQYVRQYYGQNLNFLEWK